MKNCLCIWEKGCDFIMTIFSSCSEKPSAGTFSTASQTALAANSVIGLTQRALVGTSISFTAPNTINLKPGSYIVNYALMGNPGGGAEAETAIVGLLLDGVIVAQASIANSAGPTGTADYPEATGSYLITTDRNSTLQLVTRTSVQYNVPTVNSALTAASAQTAQLTIFKLKSKSSSNL